MNFSKFWFFIKLVKKFKIGQISFRASIKMLFLKKTKDKFVTPHNFPSVGVWVKTYILYNTYILYKTDCILNFILVFIDFTQIYPCKTT